jgi:hypothetical protein
MDILTPKQRFLKNHHAKAFSDFSGTEPFRVALEYAMLELINETPSAMGEPVRGTDAHNRVMGARRFAEILGSLAEPEPKPTPLQTKKLTYA